ncbi:hypothetical protein ODJ79_21450 [Actinoplanes sp. KI2]|uniref:hypothetical protein n=1 Tax=Actinoplanes sp. KI2 TaxID=2983315 RepID=UPI0021D5767E|nr:hypothetical protein [Actinoplanes sp. KI2]MCU7726303.1 hypothetical protein [Actinoplanes sp. KI2]
MTARPRSRGGGDDPEPPHRGDGDEPSPRPRPPASNVAEGEQHIQQVLGGGHPRTAGTAREPGPEDPEVAHAMRIYDQLGPDPPKIHVARNDANHARAHTIERHGPDLPLRQQAGVQTIEGRIYGDHGWEDPENQSFKWDNATVMTREINEYVQRNWENIRSDLALKGFHQAGYNTGHRVGEGFLNGGIYGLGARQAEYMSTGLVKIRIRLVPDADPARSFLVSAFPAGIL